MAARARGCRAATSETAAQALTSMNALPEWLKPEKLALWLQPEEYVWWNQTLRIIGAVSKDENDAVISVVLEQRSSKYPNPLRRRLEPAELAVALETQALRPLM